jgi:hypothetical protein
MCIDPIGKRNEDCIVTGNGAGNIWQPSDIDGIGNKIGRARGRAHHQQIASRGNRIDPIGKHPAKLHRGGAGLTGVRDDVPYCAIPPKLDGA